MQSPRHSAHASLRAVVQQYRRERPSAGPLIPRPGDQRRITPQGCGCGSTGGSCSCASGVVASIYAAGTIAAVFPSMSVEKEFYQVAGDSTQHMGPGTLYSVLSHPENLYLAREMIWILRIAGIDTYVVQPSTEAILLQLVASLAPSAAASAGATADDSQKIDTVYGRGLGATSELPTGDEALPVVRCEHTASVSQAFMAQQIGAAMARQPSTQASAAGQAPPNAADIAKTLWRPLNALTANPGRSDADRAINEVLLGYPEVYALTWQMMHGGATPGPRDQAGFSLARVRAMPAPVQGDRQVFDVLFHYRGNTYNAASVWACRVDVTGLYPYIASEFAPYIAL